MLNNLHVVGDGAETGTLVSIDHFSSCFCRIQKNEIIKENGGPAFPRDL